MHSEAKGRADWSPGKIKYELEKCGIAELADLDSRARLPRGTVSQAIRRPSASGEAAISSALKVPAAVIWPSRYDDRGERLKPQPPMNYIARSLERHRQKRRVA